MAIDGRQLYSRITWRLIPYLFLLYILAYLDRVNVGFAAASMQHDLRLSDTVYGIGGGIFFIGSALFDLPSNLLLNKYGPRRWISRIMITWGVMATAMALVTGPHSFYVLRFFLGVSEAGFFPGIILYLTYWYPTAERARAVAKFMTATSLAGVVGGPLSSFLLKMEGRSGLHGWQWLFLVEGVPSVLMGISVLFLLNDRPDDAGWLNAEEKAWLDDELERDRQEGGAAGRHKLSDAFKLPMVWMIAAFYTVSQIGVYTVNLWMPKVLNSFVKTGAGAAHDAGLVARYSTLPYLMAAICTVLVGWSSDRTKERKGHIAGCLLLAAVGFAWVAVAHSMVGALCAFTCAAVGLWSMMGPFWTLPTRVLGGRAAAGGVALITVLGGVGAALGPSITGWLRDLTDSYTAGLYVISGLAVFGAVLCLMVRERPPLASE